MKRNNVIIVLAVFVVVIGGLLIYRMKVISNTPRQACAFETKACLDGSVVGRTGLNCEFAACPPVNENATPKLSEEEALDIGKRECVKDGEYLQSGYYNAASKTWWFDVALIMSKEGCTPGCVVKEDKKTAEINWRCTGAITPQQSSSELRKLFVDKYPKSANEVQVNIEQGVGEPARGSVISKVGMPGWVLLAIKNNNEWQVVFDGDGDIDCEKLHIDYGFSDTILTPEICN
ncbi:hypothetical protein L6270_04435 [Candidatus Parcubacteria bacterium]|nr:hypothetical protein [Patescibacteria group bacterium]MBU4309210.1 hypothetical protein [Patescibacteria group bacterium]MBU4432626.1 hypothetical protein [Patescibacteria group bacterium]MBU4577571.1 hypothetical protein [Patescibacteria group bacterium]MCG2697258.1 hypothetical protein [Candidatus Parcubacteria bacterium]